MDTKRSHICMEHVVRSMTKIPMLDWYIRECMESIININIGIKNLATSIKFERKKVKY